MAARPSNPFTLGNDGLAVFMVVSGKIQAEPIAMAAAHACRLSHGWGGSAVRSPAPSGPVSWPFLGLSPECAGSPNKAHAAWGRRAHRLEPNPATAPMVRWMFAQRLAGHSVARITRALNDAGIPCPSASDPQRNPHRTGAAWTLATVASILANPRYTGRQVWNRQRTDADLVDPANTGLGHKPVQRWNLPAGWVISARPAHPALVSEADYIAAQDVSAPRGPTGPATRRYLLAGLLVCGTCGRRLESAWSNGKPAYRCRHGYTSATGPGPGRPKNVYVREDQILPRLAALAILLAGRPGHRTKRPAAHLAGPAQTAMLIDRLRADGVRLIYDPATRTLRTDTEEDPIAVAVSQGCCDYHHSTREKGGGPVS